MLPPPETRRSHSFNSFGKKLPPRPRALLPALWKALFPWIERTGLLHTKAWNITDVPSQEGVPKTCSSFWWQWRRIRNASQWQPPSKPHFLSGSQSSGPPALPEHFVIWQPHKSGTRFGDCINCPGWCFAMNSFTYRPKLYLLTEWLFHLLKWFSTGGMVSCWGHSVKPTDISGYHTLVRGGTVKVLLTFSD